MVLQLDDDDSWCSLTSQMEYCPSIYVYNQSLVKLFGCQAYTYSFYIEWQRYKNGENTEQLKRIKSSSSDK